MTQEDLVLAYDQLIHKYKGQLCVLKTMRTLIHNMEDSVSSDIDFLNTIIEKLPD